MSKVTEKITELNLEDQTSRHSRWNYLSYAFFEVPARVLPAFVALFSYFYWHAVIGLDPWLILLANGILTLWYALNDPLIGYFTDRNFKWTKKWGRRFPWIAIGLILWCTTFFIGYAAPSVEKNPWPAFFWLILSGFMIEFFSSLFKVHNELLRSEKFRTTEERRISSKYTVPVAVISLFMGSLIPPLMLSLSGGSYTLASFLVGMFCLVFVLLYLLLGAREDELMIERFYTKEYSPMKFLKGAINAIKQRSFIAFFVRYIATGVAGTVQMGMIIYASTFVLRSQLAMTLGLVSMMLGVLISIPLWYSICKRMNNSKRFFIIGSLLLSASTIPLTFFFSTIDFLIYLFISGIMLGSVWVVEVPIILPDVLDDYAVITKKNQKGILMGVWAVMGLMTLFLDELIIGTVFSFTGFSAGIETYEALIATVENVDLVLWGIRFLLGVIPGATYFLTTLFFWKIYPLTPNKVLENKKILKELNF